MKRALFLAVLSAYLVSCGSNGANTATQSNSDSMSMSGNQDSMEHARINAIAIANQKDPVCDMPLTRGFEDTTMYNGKVIGFCSKECKQDFTAKPDSFKVQ